MKDILYEVPDSIGTFMSLSTSVWLQNCSSGYGKLPATNVNKSMQLYIIIDV